MSRVQDRVWPVWYSGSTSGSGSWAQWGTHTILSHFTSVNELELELRSSVWQASFSENEKTTELLLRIYPTEWITAWSHIDTSQYVKGVSKSQQIWIGFVYINSTAWRRIWMRRLAVLQSAKWNSTRWENMFNSCKCSREEDDPFDPICSALWLWNAAETWIWGVYN